jgi:hypothetical protein
MKCFGRPEFRVREETKSINRVISEPGWIPILGEAVPMIAPA